VIIELANIKLSSEFNKMLIFEELNKIEESAEIETQKCAQNMEQIPTQKIAEIVTEVKEKSEISESNAFPTDSFFAKSPTDSANNKEKTSNIEDSNIESLFGNFGQQSTGNDSPFNFNFGNSSNTSNSSNSPPMWR
jgi:hypothetical protein